MKQDFATSAPGVDIRRRLDELCDEFESELRSGRAVDIASFANRMSGDGRMALLRELVALQLGHHILTGQPARVEHALREFPELAARPEDVVELIVAEWEARRQHGEAVRLSEYFDRFSAERAALEQRLQRDGYDGLSPTSRSLPCPQCRHPVAVPDRADPREANCPSCGTAFQTDRQLQLSWAPGQLPKLGRFQLQHAVGRGAFGTVYRAIDTQLGRTVAVKVPRSGTFIGRDDEERFAREARNAAKLKHPNIVSVYEVGQGDGFPFIVTEFVEGVTLGDAFSAYQFTHAESAEIAAELADALDHSHQQGVVHRDVKPSNVMLEIRGTASTSDSGRRSSNSSQSRYRPRLTDFGLARRDDGDATMTSDGQVVGTPAYMSPEQARGESDRVDGRSDVYSLGCVLYQMLTRELPFRGHGRMVLHQVIHDEPRAPRQLDDSVPRDLETICLRCLEKDPSRRYPTAGELAEDLRRYQRGEPIVARSVGRLERAWRWCRRHPAVASLTAVVATLLLSISVISTSAAWRLAELRTAAVLAGRQAQASAARERDERLRAEAAEAQAQQETERANQEAASARQVADFLVHVFQSSDPLGLEGTGFAAAPQAHSTLLARDVLQLGARRIQTEFTEPTLLKAELLDVVGFVCCNLGMFTEARPLLEESLSIRERLLPPDHPKLGLSLFHVGWLYQDLTDYPGAESRYRRALELRQKQFGADSLEVAEVKFRMAWLALELLQHAESENLFREVLAIRRRKLPPDHRDIAIAESGLATTLMSSGKMLEAFTIALSNMRNPSDAVLAANQYVMASTYRRSRDLERSDQAYQKSIESLEKCVGRNHPVMMLLLGDYAGMLREKGDLPRAEAIIQEALEIGHRTLPNHPRVIEAERLYADALVGGGRAEDALPRYDQALRSLRTRPQPATRELVDLLRAKARALRQLDRTDACLDTVREAIDLVIEDADRGLAYELVHEAADIALAAQRYSRAVDILAPTVARFAAGASDSEAPPLSELRAKLGRCRFLNGEADQGESELLVACETLLRAPGPDAPSTQQAMRWLVEILEQTGKSDQAAAYRQALKP